MVGYRWYRTRDGIRRDTRGPLTGVPLYRRLIIRYPDQVIDQAVSVRDHKEKGKIRQEAAHLTRLFDISRSKRNRILPTVNSLVIAEVAKVSLPANQRIL